MTGPVLERMERQCREIGGLIGAAVDGINAGLPDDQRVGFCLMLFTFNRGFGTWITNAERENMVEGVRELLSKIEAADREWLDIDSAPRDEIILASGDGMVWTAAWDNRGWYDSRTGVGICPTHWLPIPGLP